MSKPIFSKNNERLFQHARHDVDSNFKEVWLLLQSANTCNHLYLILGVPKILFRCCRDLWMAALVRWKWTEAWKCRSNSSSASSYYNKYFHLVMKYVTHIGQAWPWPDRPPGPSKSKTLFTQPNLTFVQACSETKITSSPRSREARRPSWRRRTQPELDRDHPRGKKVA